MLAKVSTECLVANQKSQLPEEIFTRLSQARADFALILNQRLIEAKSNVLEMKNHLTTTWETIRTLRGSFERAVSNGDADYYRSLLKLLFLALRVHADDATAATENLRASLRITQSSPIIPTLLDILKYVVAIGLREIVSSIHENAAESTPEDIALLTGILQSILRIPGIEYVFTSSFESPLSSCPQPTSQCRSSPGTFKFKFFFFSIIRTFVSGIGNADFDLPGYAIPRLSHFSLDIQLLVSPLPFLAGLIALPSMATLSTANSASSSY